jgi:hypothetical protein
MANPLTYKGLCYKTFKYEEQLNKEKVMYNIINTKTGEVLKSFASVTTAYLWLECWDSYPSICSVVKSNK